MKCISCLPSPFHPPLLPSPNQWCRTESQSDSALLSLHLSHSPFFNVFHKDPLKPRVPENGPPFLRALYISRQGEGYLLDPPCKLSLYHQEPSPAVVPQPELKQLSVHTVPEKLLAGREEDEYQKLGWQ